MKRAFITTAILMLSFVLLCFVAGSEVSGQQVRSETDMKIVFDEKYEAWKEWRKKHSYRSDHACNKPFGAIVKLGVNVLPHIFGKMESYSEDSILEIAVLRITGKRFEKPELSDLGGSEMFAKLYIRWWEEGHKQTRQKFEETYRELRKQKSRDSKGAKDRCRRIRNLGIQAIPYAIKKIRGGDTEMVPLLSELTGGETEKAASASECVSWWNSNKEKWTIPFPK